MHSAMCGFELYLNYMHFYTQLRPIMGFLKTCANKKVMFSSYRIIYV